MLRIDITSISPPDSHRSAIDSALRVKYAPATVKQLLVTTAKNKLLKFDTRTGKILAEVRIHTDWNTDVLYFDKCFTIWPSEEA